jgi:hypothetical protein
LCGLQFVPDLIQGLQFQTDQMRAAISPDMYATDVALDRVQFEGMAFRDAYRQAIDPGELARRTPELSLSARISPGSCNDLMLEELKRRLNGLTSRRTEFIPFLFPLVPRLPPGNALSEAASSRVASSLFYCPPTANKPPRYSSNFLT